MIDHEQIKAEMKMKIANFNNAERNGFIALQHVAGVGWQTCYKLLDGGYNMNKIKMNATVSAPSGISGHRWSQLHEKWKELSIINWTAEYAKHSAKVVLWGDKLYPPGTADLPQPPWALYYKGDISIAHQTSIAIVGTRKASAYGLQQASRFSTSFSAKGIAVVSGLARGIDTAAHHGGLSSKGSTIAVLASGLEHSYPPENVKLQERIAREGLILTEYAVGTIVRKGLFPQRNRLIAALAKATLIIEAPIKSGALITADIALSLNRDIFAIPGPIHTPSHSGCHYWIQQGAKLVTSVEDVTDELNMNLDVSPEFIENKSAIRTSEMEQKILQYVEKEPLGLDQLLELTKLDFGQLQSVLLSLLNTRQIQQLPGSRYYRM